MISPNSEVVQAAFLQAEKADVKRYNRQIVLIDDRLQDADYWVNGVLWTDPIDRGIAAKLHMDYKKAGWADVSIMDVQEDVVYDVSDDDDSSDLELFPLGADAKYYACLKFVRPT